MSQLVATAHTSADSIPLGRRIAEIMHEKGQAYSITTMAKRLGFNRETFRLMLKGDREIYSYELERIAQDLKVPVERILQNDVLKESRELKELLQNLSDKNRAIEIAKNILDSALGLTERCIALNYFGNALYHLREFDQAHQQWLYALPEARVILEKYNDSKLLLKIIANLMLSYTIRKEFSNLYEIVVKAEPFFDDNPQISAVICYSLAKIKEQQKDIEGAREKHYQSLKYYGLTNNLNSIAKSKHNVAAFEYRQKNYPVSLEYFALAYSDFQSTQDLFGKLFCLKEYVKVLIKLQRIEEAEEIIEFTMGNISGVEDELFLDLKSQLYVLLSIAKNEPLFAEKVILGKNVSTSICRVAGKFLVEYYYQVGDYSSMAKYYKVVNGLFGTQMDILHEEDL